MDSTVKSVMLGNFYFALIKLAVFGVLLYFFGAQIREWARTQAVKTAKEALPFGGD